ncbi:MAG TPA: hypothetical protein VF696_00665 [Candidatus Paceibacterota bacterium]|jgi:oligoribonuclease NrnB/cAMP/cGMP phosphodiesterase (DHH superfamily)
MDTPKTVILYHGGCPDGFGGAYAAWKKFGDSVEYIPLHRGEPLPQGIDGANIYIIDFTYTRDVMDELVSRAASVVALDHHDGVREIVEAMPEYVFDNNRSGATLAWNYFHPDIPEPYFLTLLEDQDLFRHANADTIPLHTYLEVHPFTFESWDEIATKLENQESREAFLERTRIYAEYFELLADMAVNKAKLVRFEGREVFFGVSHPFKSLKSRIGSDLARKQGPFALVVAAHPEGYGVSIRGDGSVNVAEIAQKFGGNGHPRSAGFLVRREGPFPWELIRDDENTGN